MSCRMYMYIHVLVVSLINLFQDIDQFVSGHYTVLLKRKLPAAKAVVYKNYKGPKGSYNNKNLGAQH